MDTRRSQLLAACTLVVLTACCFVPADAQTDDPLQVWLGLRQTLLGDRSLIAYYDFQEGAGDALTNRVSGGEALNGAIHGATWAEGRWPGKHALAFDGRSAYVEIPHHESLYPFAPGDTGELTVAVSVFVEIATEAGLVDKSSAGWGRDTPYALWVTSRNLAAGVGDGSGCSMLRDSVEVPLGRWLSLVLVVDAARMRLYKNGLLIGVASRLTPADNDRPLLLGCMKPGTYHFHGRLDEVALYNRALTDTEIRRAARMKTLPTIDIP